MFYSLPNYKFAMSICFVMLACLMAQPSFAISNIDPSFNEIDVERVKAPIGFENSVTYSVKYFHRTKSSVQQVFPSFEDKKRDSDLILARVLRQFLDEEYHLNHKGMDEYVVEESDHEEIMYLTSYDFLSKAWNWDNLDKLSSYILGNAKNMELYTLNIYLDYIVDENKYFSGNDMNPILVKFSEDPKFADEITFIIVNLSEDRRKNG